ncbi:hypothetical protein [Mycobacteroides abscessus]|uniref:hypothetical protein n=1 Tax=Mycobacteroides abscessus TaxID=36809 RepID=UPI0012FFE122|nr:hypothetical protein [Mycobacteroides abscessus]MDO2970940.1 hypothetical protein [Mycobacteroides abscessus subsp. bolletii]MDO3078325.1 hypothetical protein [Mycobacteroides abscessus subsp. bolletii]MDO3110872.1 hypothetical protein [Mycobacteroides abscessus subsp. abscessus]
MADDATAWNRHLLVITADCDFAHDKHHGRVTCVPLLTKDEYLLELQIPKFRHQALVKVVAALQEVLESLGRNGISETRLREWPLEQSTDAILTLLAIAGDKRDVVGGMVDAIRELGSAASTVAEATAALVQAQRRLPNAQSEKNLRTNLVGRLQNAFKQPPGDALFVSALADGHDYGYFVYLRHLEQIWEPQVSLGPSRSVVEYRRLSRLQEKYTHAIAQRFALVFMTIGLPDAYEEMRDLHADLLGEDIP